MATATFTVSSGSIFTPEGVKVTLRGINLPLLDDWNFPGSDHLADLETSGANCVRIQWYIKYPNPARPSFSLDDLGEFLARCKAASILPILGLWDVRCPTPTDPLNVLLVPWWTRPDVVATLNAHQDYLILNLANELGKYHFGDGVTSLTQYRDAYVLAVHALRAAGLKMPIMIDAPDCGTSLDAFTTVIDPPMPVGREMLIADPEHNLIFSAHAYWAGTDRSATIVHALAADLPLVFGEIANRQADGGDECHFSLDGSRARVPAPSGFAYQTLLTKILESGTGWLAWAWAPDACADRNLAIYRGGRFAGLTPYGDDIVNNPVYGLKATAVRFRHRSTHGHPHHKYS